jgi:hypothetical protein
LGGLGLPRFSKYAVKLQNVRDVLADFISRSVATDDYVFQCFPSPTTLAGKSTINPQLEEHDPDRVIEADLRENQ